MASASNIVFRVIIAGILGPRPYCRWSVIAAALPILAALGLLMTWNSPW